MAKPPPEPQDPEQTVEDYDMSDAQPYSNDLEHEPQAEDGQYHEVTSTERDPTKSGEEDELHLDSDRPGTAGTGHSQELPEDDQQFLERTGASNKPQDDSIASQPLEGSFLSRVAWPAEPDGNPGFTFGAFSGHQMDFEGTRKKIPVSMPAERPQLTQPESIVDAADEGVHNTNVPADTPHVVDPQVNHAPVQPTKDMQQQGHPQPDDVPINQTFADRQTHTRSKKGKGKRRQRHQSMPVRQAGDVSFTATEDTPVVAETLHQELQLPDQAPEAWEDAQEELSHVEEARPTTPDQSTIDQYQQPQSSSPHAQLQGDLDTTVQRTTYVQQMDEVADQHPDNHLGAVPSLEANVPLHEVEAYPQRKQARRVVPHAKNQDFPIAAFPKAKKNTKPSRKASTPARSVSDANANSESEINDYMQILIYKIRQESHQALQKLTAERDACQEEVRQLQESMQNLHDDFTRVHQDKDDLTSTCDKQKTKLVSYEARVKKFKTFIDGLGHDVDSLKREANATRRKSEQLVQESQDGKAEREALLEQLNSCTERSTQLKNEALKACQEAQSDLKLTEQGAGYLEGQLSEKVGLLAEERDRCAQLERRLLSATDPSEKVMQAIRINNDALLDKLHVVHATLESTDVHSKMSNLLGQILEAVQAVNSRTETSADDVVLTKGLVEAMSDRLSEIEDQGPTQALKKQLDDVLAGLKGVADHQEDRVRQDAAHREAMSGVQEKLKGSNARVANAEGALQLAQAREGTLKEEIQKLQDKIAVTRTQPTSTGNAQGQLEETRVELHAKAKALESTKSDLAGRTAELTGLKKANEELNNTMQRLHEKIEELEQTQSDLVPGKQAVEEQIRKEVERIREESLKHSQDFRAQLEMESKNQLRKLTSDRDRYEKQVTPLKAELANGKKQMEELQKRVTESTARKEHLERVKKLAGSQTKEIETLKSSLRDLQQSADVDASLKEKLAGMSAELDTEKPKLQEAIHEKAALMKKADGYLHDTEEANKTCEQPKAELVTYRADMEVQLEKLKEAVNTAQEAKQRAEAGQEHFRKSCDAAIEDEANKGRRKVEGLQTELDQVKAELGKERTDGEGFRADVEKQWQLTNSDHAHKVDDLRGQIETAETAKDEALANTERSIEERRTLLDQVDVLKQRLASAEEKLKRQQESPAKDTEAPSRLKVPISSEGITPSASERSAEPTRPRKKVDRNHGSTLDSSALPVPEVLRPDSRRAGSSKGKQAARDAVIEDSQAAETQFTKTSALPAISSAHGNFAMFSDNEDMSYLDQSFQSQHPTERVEETQFDSLPSFAAFTQKHSTSNAPRFNQMSPSLSMTYDNGREGGAGTSALGGIAPEYSRRAGAAQLGGGSAAHQSDANFAIYEDTQDMQNCPAYPQNAFDWSQEERDKYTFRKRMPQPNSASKLVREGGEASMGGKRRASGLQERQPLKERRLETPEVRGEATQFSQRSAAYSSSPGFVQPTPARRTRTYSNTPKGTAKRQSSRTQPTTSQDPRLVGRNPPPAPKRKAENHVVEGYEQERKKRLSAAATAGQQSIRDLPSFPAMPANPRGSNTQSRLRALGGGSSRAPASKQASSNNDMSSRFSQELGRR